MTSIRSNSVLLDILAAARRVANYAETVGFDGATSQRRKQIWHLGALLADAILQAGVNYHTVVRPRVERIVKQFPESATLSGTMKFVESDAIYEFLMWTHFDKVERFRKLLLLLAQHDIEDSAMLRHWLKGEDCREELLGIRGIGPKTVDYLGCLAGLDNIAVDRHIRSFAKQAGVATNDYQQLRSVFCYAADLLGTSRRSFDAWVWANQSKMHLTSRQYVLL